MVKYARRRQVERIRLGIHLDGRLGNVEVIVLDLSLLGCRLEHKVPLKVGVDSHLKLRWKDEVIDIECRVVRCVLDTNFAQHEGTVYQSGARFTQSDAPAGDALRRVLTTYVMEALEEQKANSRGELPKFLRTALNASLDPALPTYSSLPILRVARGRGYVSYTLDGNLWRKRRTQNPTQPSDGFTVWAYEEEDQVEQLAAVYLQADADMRSMIRLCAELSLVVDDTIPPQRFVP